MDEEDLKNNLIENAPPINPDEEGTYAYPVPEDKRIGVSSDFGTDPEETDQGDEEVEREQTGIPD